METNEVTYKVQLEARETDPMGYTTFVFKRFEYDNLDDQYIMCVMFQNWNQKSIEINDVGFLSVRYVREGIDKWYDGTELIPYKSTNIIFLKFIQEQKEIKLGEIIVD